MKSNHSLRLAFIFSAIALLTFVSCSLMLLSCKKSNPIAPGPPAEPDSTSHDFTWEEISIGDDHSYLKDVFALNDTDVWAVGLFTTRKPNGDLVNHNALHWDGRTWTIVDVPALCPGTNVHLIDILVSVYAFSHDDVWFACGSVMVYWDGKQYADDLRLYDSFQGGVLKMWGKNKNDFYVVGGYGAIAHYKSGTFTKLESGTTYDVNDVWGVGDTALAVAANCLGEESASHVFRLVDGKLQEAYMSGLPQSMKSIWFCTGMRKLTAIGGFYVEWTGKEWRKQGIDPLRFFKMSIRGNSPIDYFVVDQTTGVAHFNGKSWKSWNFDTIGDNMMFSLTCTKNNVWAVGVNKFGHTLIIHGTRK